MAAGEAGHRPGRVGLELCSPGLVSCLRACPPVRSPRRQGHLSSSSLGIHAGPRLWVFLVKTLAWGHARSSRWTIPLEPSWLETQWLQYTR